MKKQRKYALVLSGGGFKGAFQVGALNTLKENWHKIAPEGTPMKFDLISGVSVGALNGAMMAMDRLDELNQLWELIAHNGTSEVYTSDFIETDPEDGKTRLKVDAKGISQHFLPNFNIKVGLLKGLGLLFSKKKKKAFFNEVLGIAAQELKENLKNFKGVADNTPLKEKLRQLVDRNAITDSEFYCGFVSLDDGKYASVKQDEFDSNEDFINGILASTAVPIVWEPVEAINYRAKQSRNNVDGGIRNVSPLGDVIEQINKESDKVEYTVIIINCANGGVLEANHDESNVLQIAMRSFQDVAQSEIFNNDVGQFLQLNSILRQVESENIGFDLYKYDTKTNQLTDRPLRYFKALLIEPTGHALGDFLIADQETIDTRLTHGVEKAQAAIDRFLKDTPELRKTA